MNFLLAQNQIKLSPIPNPFKNFQPIQAQFAGMADFEPPSFSLGLDFDLDSQQQQEANPNLSPIGDAQSAERSLGGAACHRIKEDPEHDDFETPSTVLDPPASVTTRSLKRLRRGSTSEPALVTREVQPKVQRLDADDEIEEFSEEDQPLADKVPKHQYSVCSSSKLSLHGHGVLMSQSSKQLKRIKKKEVENASSSADNIAATSKLIFPKLTVSPVRRFQLIDSDSDSDETCLDEGLNTTTNQLNSPSNDRHCNLTKVTAATDLKAVKGSVSLPQNEDLWKEICFEKNTHLPTPALDEVCEEYFRTTTDTDRFQNYLAGRHEMINSGRSNMQNNSLSSVPPAHHYYFHEDATIRELVRARLPNFFPLGSGSNQGNRHQNACTIDYMSQFHQGEASKLTKQKEKTKPSTSKRQKNVRNSEVQELSTGSESWMNPGSSAGSHKGADKRTVRKSKGQELSQGSENWVNPRSSAGIPKDAGKRRIQAVGKSAGHWYTASDGRKVYVGRNGQELTGQIAYRQYRRESGARFSGSKKKAPSKKKAATKKK